MTMLAERPLEPLRIALTGLRLWVGRRSGEAGFEVVLEPCEARRLAFNLLGNADQVERAAGPVLEELSAS